MQLDWVAMAYDAWGHVQCEKVTPLGGSVTLTQRHDDGQEHRAIAV